MDHFSEQQASAFAKVTIAWKAYFQKFHFEKSWHFTAQTTLAQNMKPSMLHIQPYEEDNDNYVSSSYSVVTSKSSESVNITMSAFRHQQNPTMPCILAHHVGVCYV